MSAALVAVGLALLISALPREQRGAATAPLALWLLGTPLFDLVASGPWPTALAFALAAGAVHLPVAAWAHAAIALGSGLFLSGKALLELDPGRALAGAFAVPDGLFLRSPVLWLALAGAIGFRRRSESGGGPAGAPSHELLRPRTPIRARRAAGGWPLVAGGGSLLLAAAAPDATRSSFLGVALAWLFPGFAAAMSGFAGLLRRRPALALTLLGLALTTWNLLSMESSRRMLVPRDDTVAFSDVAYHNAAVLRSLVGTPPAFPANVWFGARHGLSAARWDRLASAFAFEPYPGLGNEIALAGPGFDVDGLLDGGWGARVPCPPVSCRNLAEEGVVYFVLRAQTRLSLALDARGPGELEVALDGLGLGRLALDETLGRHPLRLGAPVPAGLRRLTLRPLDGARLRVARVAFIREQR